MDGASQDSQINPGKPKSAVPVGWGFRLRVCVMVVWGLRDWGHWTQSHGRGDWVGKLNQSAQSREMPGFSRAASPRRDSRLGTGKL